MDRNVQTFNRTLGVYGSKSELYIMKKKRAELLNLQLGSKFKIENKYKLP